MHENMHKIWSLKLKSEAIMWIKEGSGRSDYQLKLEMSASA
jgi:hypothetical protein